MLTIANDGCWEALVSWSVAKDGEVIGSGEVLVPSERTERVVVMYRYAAGDPPQVTFAAQIGSDLDTDPMNNEASGQTLVRPGH